MAMMMMLMVMVMVTVMMMMMMMVTMMMMVMMMLEGPICENVSQILDKTAPEPKFWTGPDQLLLQDTIESEPPEAPIWAIGDP